MDNNLTVPKLYESIDKDILTRNVGLVGNSFISQLGNYTFSEGNGFSRVKIDRARQIAIGDTRNLANVLDTSGSGISIGFNNSVSATSCVNGTIIGRNNLITAGNIIRTVSIGDESMLPVTGTCQNDTSIGYQSLRSLTRGDNNTSIGTGSLLQCQQGDLNVSIGYLSAFSLLQGNNNINIGAGAGFDTQTGIVNNSINIGNSLHDKFRFNSTNMVKTGSDGKQYMEIGFGSQTFYIPLLNALP